MSTGLVARRTQFSSCDECRRSRVACDASSRNKGADTAEEDRVPCTRCSNRRKQCTFKWMKDTSKTASVKNPTAARKKKEKQRQRRDSPGSSESTTTPQNDLVDAAAQTQPSPGASDWLAPQPQQASGIPQDVTSNPATSPFTTGIGSISPDQLSAIDASWVSTIYRGGFDVLFGSWMGSYSCPFTFGQVAQMDKYVNIIELCGLLDMWMANDVTKDRRHSTLNLAGHQESGSDLQINQSLQLVAASYSARWLPLTYKNAQDDDQGECAVALSLWRHARRDMLRVINRPCYRSMITLLLFALTPIPSGVTDEEEMDGISGQSCVHASLQQIQILRARQRNLQFSGSKVSLATKTQATHASPESLGTPDFINAESTAYWAALTFDTSASLTLNCRSLLSSGLFGFEEEMSWRLVRASARILQETAQNWSQTSLDMTDDKANQVIAAGSSWKLLGWKLTSVFKEALRDGHEEPNVRRAYNLVIGSIKDFNTIFRPLLEACQKRMHFLSQQTRLRWYSLMLHYHLSILMFSDIIEATNRYDLLADVSEMSTEAETAVLNTMVFGLQNTYTLNVKPHQEETETQRTSITVPILAVDPYPHHVVAGVQLVRKAIDRDFGLGKIAEDSYANLQATLESTLAHLPQSSKSVQLARMKLSEKIAHDALAPYQDPYSLFHAQYAE